MILSAVNLNSLVPTTSVCKSVGELTVPNKSAESSTLIFFIPLTKSNSSNECLDVPITSCLLSIFEEAMPVAVIVSSITCLLVPSIDVSNATVWEAMPVIVFSVQTGLQRIPRSFNSLPICCLTRPITS